MAKTEKKEELLETAQTSEKTYISWKKYHRKWIYRQT